MPRSYHVLLLFAMSTVLVSPVAAETLGHDRWSAHTTLTGIISKIQSGVVFVKIPVGLRPRTISPAKTDRVGLHEARVGEAVTLWVDEGNVLVDAHKAGLPFAGHRILTGNLRYVDQYWEELRLSTPEGVEGFEVDALAGSKLSVFREGTPVMVELDEDNVVIDIHRAR